MSEPPVADLISVDRAIEILDGDALTPTATMVPLGEAIDCVLAADIIADRDYPPLDKSLMDGYAIHCLPTRNEQPPSPGTPGEGGGEGTGGAYLKVIGEVAAGVATGQSIQPGEALAIMTGAPLPTGANAVIPIEFTSRDGDSLRLLRSPTPPAPGSAISRRSSIAKQGDVVLHKGTQITAVQVAAAASVGASELGVYRRPTVAVLSTGDEILPIASTPAEHQLRDANGISIASLLHALGCEVEQIEHVRDDADALATAFEACLDADLVFLIGGMSMGKYDLVPPMLRVAKFDLKISKVRLRPGKPFVFATRPAERSGDHETRVFGLPGNPVSAFVCTLRLAARVIDRMRGLDPNARITETKLDNPLPANGPREFCQPAIVSNRFVTPLMWKGSDDVFTLARANAFIVRPENDGPREVGETVRVLEVPR